MSNTIQSVNSIYVGYNPDEIERSIQYNTTTTQGNCDINKKLNAELNITDNIPFFSKDDIITVEQNFETPQGNLVLDNNGILTGYNSNGSVFWSNTNNLRPGYKYDGTNKRITNASGVPVSNPFCKIDNSTGFNCYDISGGNPTPYFSWAAGGVNALIINGNNNGFPEFTGNLTLMSNEKVVATTINGDTPIKPAINLSNAFNEAHTCDKAIAEATLISQSKEHESSNQLYQDALAIYNIQCVNRINLIIGIIGTLWYAYYLAKTNV
jgi:hypothetical protein